MSLRTTGIGSTPTPKLTAKKCVVESQEDELVEKAKATKAVFYLKHPDKEEAIKTSNVVVTRERKGKKEIVSLATWYNLDSKGLIQMDSALAKLLSFYGVNNAMEMIGKEVDTEVGTDGYLAIKAY